MWEYIGNKCFFFHSSYCVKFFFMVVFCSLYGSHEGTKLYQQVLSIKTKEFILLLVKLAEELFEWPDFGLIWNCNSCISSCLPETRFYRHCVCPHNCCTNVFSISKSLKLTSIITYFYSKVMTFYFLNIFVFAYGCLEQDIKQPFMFNDHVNSFFFLYVLTIKTWWEESVETNCPPETSHEYNWVLKGLRKNREEFSHFEY